MKLTDKQTNFIKLLRRSKDVGDGWRKVSKKLEGFVTRCVSERPELFETKQSDGQLLIRFSERGALLSDYV